MQPLRQTPRGVLLHCKVRTGQKEFSISDKGPYIEIRVKSEPLQGMANREIMRELGKLLDRPIMIVRGLKGNDKIILVQDADISLLRKAFEQPSKP